MIIESKIDSANYMKLMFTLIYRKPATFFLLLLGLIAIIISVPFFLGFNVQFEKPPYLELFFGIFILFVFPIIIYLSTKRNYKTNLRFQERITYEFTEDKIKMSGESFNSEMDWLKIYKIQELKNWVLIYQNRAAANIIPKESFDDKIDDFREMVKKKNIKYKLKK